jgi:hypothetical protein
MTSLKGGIIAFLSAFDLQAIQIHRRTGWIS